MKAFGFLILLIANTSAIAKSMICYYELEGKTHSVELIYESSGERNIVVRFQDDPKIYIYGDEKITGELTKAAQLSSNEHYGDILDALQEEHPYKLSDVDKVDLHHFAHYGLYTYYMKNGAILSSVTVDYTEDDEKSFIVTAACK